MQEQEQKQQTNDAAAAQIGQPRVLGVVQVAMIVQPDGTQGIAVNSSTVPDVLVALGMLEFAKQQLMTQVQQPAPSKIAIARGSVPRT